MPLASPPQVSGAAGERTPPVEEKGHDLGGGDGRAGTWLDVRLAPGIEAPGEARRALEHGSLPAELTGIAQLVVSELVTNSVRHGELRPGEWIGLRAYTRPDGLRVEVCDSGPGFPPPPPLPPSANPFGGRGLPIVDRLAARWGAGRTRGGRWEVWAELDGAGRPSS